MAGKFRDSLFGWHASFASTVVPELDLKHPNEAVLKVCTQKDRSRLKRSDSELSVSFY